MKRAFLIVFFALLLLPLSAAAQEQTPSLLRAIKVGGDSAYDEFILLHNDRDETIQLEEFALIKQTQSGADYTLHTFKDRALAPDEQLLLAHENSVFSDAADRTYTTALADNNVLQLRSPDDETTEQFEWQEPDDSSYFVRDGVTFTEQPYTSLDDLLEDDGVSNEEETEQPDIRITEYAFTTHANDQPWIELSSGKDERLDLDGWTISDGEKSQQLDYVISPGQHLIVPLSFDPDEESVFLKDEQDTKITSFGPITHTAGKSVVMAEDGQKVAPFSTPGRKNIVEKDEGSNESTDEDQGDNDQGSNEQNGDDESDEQDDSSSGNKHQQSKNEDGSTEDQGENKEPEKETGDIVINEVFANPEQSESEHEFIELANPTDEAISLYAWKLADKVNEFELPETAIPANGLALFRRTQTGLALNNTSETVRLIDPFGTEIVTLDYEDTTEGKSLNRADTWYKANPTPGIENADQPVNEKEDQKDEEDSADDKETNESASKDDTDQTGRDSETSTEESSLNDDHADAQQTQKKETKEPPQIRINEFLPNPEGSDQHEWIELANTSDKGISLEGVTISDEAKESDLSELSVTAGGHLLLERDTTGIALNNGGDVLSLTYGDELLDTVEYQESTEGISWSRVDDGSWKQTTPSPEQPNPEAAVVTQSASNSNDQGSKSREQKTDTPYPEVSADEWISLDDGQKISFGGIISVAPGTLKKRIAYLQAPDKGIGIQLYFHKANWPDLKQGDVIIVKGEKSVTQNGSRLLIRSKDNISVEEHTKITPVSITSLSHLNELPNNTLVQISGSLIEQRDDVLSIEAFEEEMRIDLGAADITLSAFKEFSPITATGILSREKDGITLIPLSSDAIDGEQEVTVPVLDEQQDLVVASSKEPQTLFPFLSVGAGSALLIGAKRKLLMNAMRPMFGLITKKYE